MEGVIFPLHGANGNALMDLENSGAGFPEKNDRPSLVSETEAQDDIKNLPLVRVKGGRKPAPTLRL